MLRFDPVLAAESVFGAHDPPEGLRPGPCAMGPTPEHQPTSMHVWVFQQTAAGLALATGDTRRDPVFADDDGFDHAKTEQPDGIEFVELEADGFRFFQDPRIGEPDWWRVEFHHLPRPHVTATWDGGSYGGPALF